MSERLLPDGVYAAGAGVCITGSPLSDYMRYKQARMNPQYSAQYANIPTTDDNGVPVELSIPRRTPDQRFVFTRTVESAEESRAAAD